MAAAILTPPRIGAATAPDPEYSSQRFSNDDGLPQLEFTQLAQSSDGYLWLGGPAGLARFDGEQFTVYNRRNTPVMIADGVTGLARDRQGRLWGGTPSGLLRWDDGRFISVDANDGEANPDVAALCASREGGVWVATRRAVTLVGITPPLRFPLQGTPGGASPTAICELPDGRPVVAVGRRWLVINRATGAYKQAGDEIVPPGGARTLLPDDGTGHTWAANQTTVLRLEATGWAVKFPIPPEAQGEPVGFYPDPKGPLVIWSPKMGVLAWQESANRFARVTTTEPALRRPAAVLRDREGNLWVAGGEGLTQLHPRSVNLWVGPAGALEDPAWSVSLGADGRVYCGSSTGLGVPGSRPRLAPALTPPVVTNGVHLALATRGGGLWCTCGERDLYALERPEGRWERIPTGDRRIRALYEGRDGSVWVGTDGGVLHFQNGVAVPFAAQARLQVHEILCIHEDRRGAMWFGTRGAGAYRVQGDISARYFGSEALSDDLVWTIVEDGEANLWFGTNRGLTLLHSGRWTQFAREQGLVENVIQQMALDSLDRFWMCGPRGVQRVSRRALLAATAGSTGMATNVPCVRLTPAEGLDALDLAAERQPGAAADAAGNIWFATAQGLLQIDTTRVPDVSPAPVVVIEDANFGGQWVSEPLVRRYSQPASQAAGTGKAKHLPVPHDRGREVQIRFTAANLFQARKTRFRYRLHGREEDWTYAADNRYALYANLAPGEYEFEVTAAAAEGPWNPVGARLPFSLQPRFFETGWFQFTSAASLLAGALLMARHYYRTQQRHLEADRAAIENERARIARDLHDNVGSNLTGLALQAETLGSQYHGTVADEFRRLAKNSRSLCTRLREVIWAVDPECETWESLASYIDHLTEEMFSSSGVRVRFERPMTLPPTRLRPGVRHQLVMAVKEALGNTLKHAHATDVQVRMLLTERFFTIAVRDNGVGFADPPNGGSQKRFEGGHGLPNLRSRVEAVGGTFRISSAPGAGALVLIEVPVSVMTSQKTLASRPDHESDQSSHS